MNIENRSQQREWGDKGAFTPSQLSHALSFSSFLLMSFPSSCLMCRSNKYFLLLPFSHFPAMRMPIPPHACSRRMFTTGRQNMPTGKAGRKAATMVGRGEVVV